MILAAAGLVVGTVAGGYLAFPLISERLAPSGAAAAGVAKAARGDSTKEGHGEAPPAAVVHAVDNIVLNPAGTGGTRFLMVTAAFELSDAKHAETLKSRDAELRDRLLGLLARKSVEQLADATLRDQLRSEVLATVAPMLPPKSLRRVLFPQFVIQ